MSVDLFKSRGHLLSVGENKAKEGIHRIERFFWADFRPRWDILGMEQEEARS